MGQKYGIENHGSLKDHYEVQEKLGKGTFATVKKGVNKKTGEAVAIKIIKKKKLSGKELIGIEREVDIMINLKHKNVVTLLDVFDSPKELYLVIELCKGGELFDKVVEMGSYSENLASKAIKQICTGLQYLHSKGVIHRDLKPENILYHTKDYEGLLKIMDFGLAKALEDEDGVMKTTCGTLHYVAPEVLLGHPYGKEVDLWSLGVVMFVLLAGYLPFYAEKKKHTYKLIVSGDYDFDDPVWEPISNEAKDLINKLLVITPNKRYTLEQVMAHPWIARAQSVASPKVFSHSFAEKIKEFQTMSHTPGVMDAVRINIPKNKDDDKLQVNFASFSLGQVSTENLQPEATEDETKEEEVKEEVKEEEKAPIDNASAKVALADV